MAKLKPLEREEAGRIIRACIANQMERQAFNDGVVAARLGIAKQTYQNKYKRPETFTLKEVCNLSKVLKFTPIQAASIVLGRDLTSREIKEFILL